LINLALNARDAMPNGGVLTIETANVEGEGQDSSRFAPLVSGQEVLLTVRDSGVGMDEETRAHLFEPFFTTKEPGRGTGLGLATVYGIVKQSDGHIGVRSQPGRGTSFDIYLPRTEAGGEDLAAETGVPEPLRGSETLLVVEDDQVLRKVIRSALEDKGYAVLIARDGMEALDVSGRYPGRIDLLLTDVIMPGMSGRVLADHLAQKRPGLKVLYFSGSSWDSLKNAGVVDPGIHLLRKPFFPPDLIRKVRVLDGRWVPRFLFLFASGPPVSSRRSAFLRRWQRD
jgi:CheY-like chemotaxis protein